MRGEEPSLCLNFPVQTRQPVQTRALQGPLPGGNSASQTHRLGRGLGGGIDIRLVCRSLTRKSLTRKTGPGAQLSPHFLGNAQQYCFMFLGRLGLLKIVSFGGLGGPWEPRNHPKRWGAKLLTFGAEAPVGRELGRSSKTNGFPRPFMGGAGSPFPADFFFQRRVSGFRAGI